MCRLFGMSAGAERARATFWLLDAPDSLSVQSHREPDGTGLGWFDHEGRPQVTKQPLAAYDNCRLICAGSACQVRLIGSDGFRGEWL